MDEEDDNRRHRLAYLWLFSAGIDPHAMDTNGDDLVQSLLSLLASEHRHGMQEAARAFTHGRSGQFSRIELEDDMDDTGTYDEGQLADLLHRVG